MTYGSRAYGKRKLLFQLLFQLLNHLDTQLSVKRRKQKEDTDRRAAATGEHRRRKRITSSTDSGGESEVEKSPARNKQKIIHCYGPQCIVNASRPGSKYFSDECGLKLETTRIYQIIIS